MEMTSRTDSQATISVPTLMSVLLPEPVDSFTGEDNFKSAISFKPTHTSVPDPKTGWSHWVKQVDAADTINSQMLDKAERDFDACLEVVKRNMSQLSTLEDEVAQLRRDKKELEGSLAWEQQNLSTEFKRFNEQRNALYSTIRNQADVVEQLSVGNVNLKEAHSREKADLLDKIVSVENEKNLLVEQMTEERKSLDITRAHWIDVYNTAMCKRDEVQLQLKDALETIDDQKTKIGELEAKYDHVVELLRTSNERTDRVVLRMRERMQQLVDQDFAYNSNDEEDEDDGNRENNAVSCEGASTAVTYSSSSSEDNDDDEEEEDETSTLGSDSDIAVVDRWVDVDEDSSRFNESNADFW